MQFIISLVFIANAFAIECNVFMLDMYTEIYN